jgi:hypothetical protein
MSHLLMNSKAFSLVLTVLAIPFMMLAQEQIPERILMHNEVPDAHSIYIPLDEVNTSPAYTYKSASFFTTQVNINADGENILGDAANEPSIAIDPTDPNRIMIGWRQFDNVSSNFRQAGYAYTLDGGQTWTFPGPINPGVFRSDPVLDADEDGNFFYNSLTVNSNGDYLCTVYRADNSGMEWDDGTFAQGGDKQWMVIDKTDSEGSGNNYSNWTKNYSYCDPNFFTRSTNGAYTFEPCSAIPGNPYWGTLAVGPEGELYIAGTSYTHDILVTKSLDAKITGSDVTWTMSTPVDLDGRPDGWVPVNPQGLLGQVYVDVDVSDGPGEGNVYVLASLDRNSNTDPADVMFARSTDGGMNWDPPVRINDDPYINRYQWLGTMSVAPNGRIDAVWLDTRVDPWNTVESALFYSYSVDQGVTWSANVQLSDMFDPHLGWPDQDKMGDYYDMISDEGGAHLAWANTLNSEQDVYYAYIEPGAVGINEGINDKEVIFVSNYPNPFYDQTTIRYSLSHDSHIRLAIFDIYGKEVKEILDQDKTAGIYTLELQLEDLPSGVYICRLHTENKIESSRMIKVAH